LILNELKDLPDPREPHLRVYERWIAQGLDLAVTGRWEAVLDLFRKMGTRLEAVLLRSKSDICEAGKRAEPHARNGEFAKGWGSNNQGGTGLAEQNPTRSRSTSTLRLMRAHRPNVTVRTDVKARRRRRRTMRRILWMAALAALVGMLAAYPALAQEDPDTPVSGTPGGGTSTPSDCEALQATGADIDCEGDEPSGDNPVSGDASSGDFNSRSECERFNEQYGTEIDCSVLSSVGEDQYGGDEPPAQDPPAGNTPDDDGSNDTPADGDGDSSDERLPDTGGVEVGATLAVGAILVAAGLLARRLLG